ncbi:hypothetical protein RRG08_028625 [Elysia crispata]|uniref:Uncharacterized protein n=1 Tax=Elysia crispata TaxID=231223 RepID=A0AAE0ZRX8_9GAST|nr:hypothetical protein RRG08_028625 [Elysia crispata]
MVTNQRYVTKVLWLAIHLQANQGTGIKTHDGGVRRQDLGIISGCYSSQRTIHLQATSLPKLKKSFGEDPTAALDEFVLPNPYPDPYPDHITVPRNR